MGGVTSKNEVNNTVNAFVRDLTSIQQLCSATVKNQINWNIKDENGNIVIHNVDWSQYAIVNVQCLQKNDVKNKIDQKIQQTIKNQATSINRAFKIPSGSTTAENVTNLVTNLGLTISNTFKSSCLTSLSQQASLTATNKNGNITIYAFKIHQVAEAFTKCVQQSSAVNNASQALQQYIAQYAKAVVKSALALIAMALLLFMLLPELLGGSLVLMLKSIMSIVFLILTVVCGYMLVAYRLQLKPYKKVPPPPPAPAKPSKNPKPTTDGKKREAIIKKNHQMFVASLFGFIGSLLLSIMMAKMADKRKKGKVVKTAHK